MELWTNHTKETNNYRVIIFGEIIIMQDLEQWEIGQRAEGFKAFHPSHVL